MTVRKTNQFSTFIFARKTDYIDYENLISEQKISLLRFFRTHSETKRMQMYSQNTKAIPLSIQLKSD